MTGKKWPKSTAIAWIRPLAIAAIAAWSSGSAGAAGFTAPDPGIKAMGMAGAFAAQADDPTACFYNPGGLALFKKGKLTVGVAADYLNEAQFQGLAPGIGQGNAGQQKKGFTVPPHVYVVQPLGEKFKLGIAVYTPFSFKTAWDAPDTFAGRFLATRGQIQTYDLNPNISWKIAPSLGLGAGVIYRSAKLSMGRRLSGFNSNAGEFQDVGSFAIDTDWDTGIGWDAGFLNKIGERFSWGVTYRSPISIDFAGAGRLTQISTGDAQVDALNRASLPYDTNLPVGTSVGFPDTATLAVGFAPSPKLWVETDVTQTGWKHFKGLAVIFPSNPSFSRTVQGAWDDALSYRLGVQLKMSKGMVLRLGYAYEESPQPDASVSPFLADAKRSIVSAGFGRDWLDIGFQFIAPESRTTLANADSLNGIYKGNTYVLGISVTKK
jgi:long-chain fatty acid transport protein